jgi:Flp pilus assembly protein TadD
MHSTKHARARVLESAVVFLIILSTHISRANCQDSGEEGAISRGDRAEISVTVRDNSGQPIKTSANIKLYKNGIPIDQSSTSHGRAFFIPHSLGDFSIFVEAAGFKTTQKDISLSVPIKAEIDIYLQEENASDVSAAVPGKPLLAPKAKEAVVKALEALRDNKLEDAEKNINQAAKLAPGHPEVLYVQGMVYMRRSNWAEAATILEKSDQLGPNEPRVLSALGLALCNDRKYDQAIPPLEKSLKLLPAASWETDWALGRSYYYTGQYDKALAMAQQARNGPPGSNPQADLLLAQCLTAVGRYEDSAQVLREFLKNNRNSPDTATARRWLDALVADGKVKPAGVATP